MSKRVRTSLRASNKGRSLRPKAVVGRRSLLPGELPGEVAAPFSDETPPSVPERLTVPEAPAARVFVEAPVPAAAAPFTPGASDAQEAVAKVASDVEEADAEARESQPPDPLADAIRAASGRSEAASDAPSATTIEEESVSREPEREVESKSSSGEETKKVDAPVEVAERASRPEAIAVQASAVEAEDEAPRARKPEEDLDASGVSAEFFRDDEASLAPTIENVPEETTMRVVLSPAAVARRARFRRVVAGVVAFTGVLALAVIGKSIAAPRKHAAVAAVTVAAPAAPLPVVEPPKAEPAAAKVEPPPAAEEKKTDDAKAEAKADEAPAADEKKADDKDAKADDKKADDKKADDKDAKTDDKKDEAAGEPDPAAAKKLQQETLSLLNRGRSKEAIEKAREAIKADPSDAIAYLYLGSALQDSGHWKDGIDAYSECVRNATKGSVNECRVMGGHK